MWMFRIFRWVLRIKSVVAITACHADQIRRLNVLWILKIFLQRPLRFVEVWIRKLAQAHDACWLAGNIRDTFTGAFVEPESVLIRSCSLRAARFRNHSKIAEASTVAARIHVLKQVGCAIRDHGDLPPQALISGCPEVPGVASATLQRREFCAAVIVGVIVRRLWRRAGYD